MTTAIATRPAVDVKDLHDRAGSAAATAADLTELDRLLVQARIVAARVARTVTGGSFGEVTEALRLAGREVYPLAHAAGLTAQDLARDLKAATLPAGVLVRIDSHRGHDMLFRVVTRAQTGTYVDPDTHGLFVYVPEYLMPQVDRIKGVTRMTRPRPDLLRRR